MTFSLLAYDAETGEIGAAAATGTPVVGGFVLHAAADAGAIATQGYSTSTLYGPAGLKLLADGAEAEAVCRALTETDAGAARRQLLVLDAAGGTAGHTGAANVPAMTHLCAPGLAAAGNWVARESVVEAMLAAYEKAAGSAMALRLIAVLQAGEAEGGDSRGARSAAIRIVARTRPPLDLRVDLDEAPITRLRDILEAVEEADFKAFLARIPTLDDPMRC